MGKYQLVNPVIIGTFANTYDAKNPDEAAKNFWEKLTSDNKYVTGNIPKFLFTLKNDESSELYHYMVKEKLEGHHADYVITKVNVDISANQQRDFLKKSSEVKETAEQLMTGGAKRSRYKDDIDDDSDSSDQDLDDLFKYVRLKKAVKPIVYWWYTPSLYKIDNIFTPSFVAPISPYVQLWIPN
jgi:sulfite reductase alpha subunit-like flavoprotein